MSIVAILDLVERVLQMTYNLTHDLSCVDLEYREHISHTQKAKHKPSDEDESESSDNEHHDGNIGHHINNIRNVTIEAMTDKKRL